MDIVALRFAHFDAHRGIQTLGCLFHSLNHLSSLGSIQPVLPSYVAHQAKSITRTISVLTGTHLPLGEEKQLWSSVLS